MTKIHRNKISDRKAAELMWHLLRDIWENCATMTPSDTSKSIGEILEDSNKALKMFPEYGKYKKPRELLAIYKNRS
jgi:hypothetical protein